MNVRSTCSRSWRRSSPVSTKMQVSWSPIARCTSAAATEESTPPDSPQMTRAVADQLANRRDLALDERARRPSRAVASQTSKEEVRDHLAAARRVRDLGVKLHAVDRLAIAWRNAATGTLPLDAVTTKPGGGAST